MFHPPFRHRGLPHPPRSCHPLCDANWNCPNCSSCRPLMGTTSPSDQYYSHSYSAVYETIDDNEDDDFQQTENEDEDQTGEIIQSFPETIDAHQSGVPYHVSPNGVNNKLQQLSEVVDKRDVAETGFNGDELSDNMLIPKLPKYVEHNGALPRSCEPSIHNHHLLNSSRVSASGDCYTPAPTNYSHRPLLPAPSEHPMFQNSSVRTFAANQAHHHQANPNTSELYMPRSATEPATRYITERSNNGHPNIKPPAYSRGHSDRCHTPVQVGHTSSFNNGQHNPNIHQHNNRYDIHAAKSCNIPSCAQPSTFLPNIPNHYFCPACHQDNSYNFSNNQSVTSTNKN